MAMILITHDLGLAARYCDRIAVMEARPSGRGRPTGALFGRPRASLHAAPGRSVADPELDGRQAWSESRRYPRRRR